ncbi:C-type lectin domain family 4 member E-like [Stigmatopora argus]
MNDSLDLPHVRFNREVETRSALHFVRMSEPEVLYTDLAFIKLRGNAARDAASTEPETNYASLEVARSQSQPSQGAALKKSKWTTERKALVVLGILLISALVGLCLLAFRIVQLGKENRQLLSDQQVLLRKSCLVSQDDTLMKCGLGWEPHGESYYYFSNVSFSWEKSRNFCRIHAGDLVKIESQDEQTFLHQRLGDIMSSPEDKFWIGLTDSEEEGRWLWVDGSLLNASLAFWSKGEPDDFETEYGGEDCARMGEMANSKAPRTSFGLKDLQTWFDKACQVPHKWVCEKKGVQRKEHC